MTEFQSQSSLHEKAVQAVARGEVSVPRRRVRAGQRTLAVTSRAERVPALLLAEARRLVGPGQKLVIVGANDVRIVNR